MKRMRLLILAGMAALLTLGVLAPAAGAASFRAGPDDTEVYGYVIGYGGVGRSYWQRYMTGADIWLHDSATGQPVLMDKTDSFGNYDFAVNLKTQEHKKGGFFVSPTHFYTATLEVHSSPGEAVNKVFKCEVLPTILTGKVINQKTKKPVAGAKIQILNWDVTTNKQGIYKVQLTLKPNTIYNAWCNKAGFARKKKRVKSLPTATGTVRTLNFQIVKRTR